MNWRGLAAAGRAERSNSIGRMDGGRLEREGSGRDVGKGKCVGGIGRDGFWGNMDWGRDMNRFVGIGAADLGRTIGKFLPSNKKNLRT
jgi:hypothetical protein